MIKGMTRLSYEETLSSLRLFCLDLVGRWWIQSSNELLWMCNQCSLLLPMQEPDEGPGNLLSWKQLEAERRNYHTCLPCSHLYLLGAPSGNSALGWGGPGVWTTSATFKPPLVTQLDSAWIILSSSPELKSHWQCPCGNCSVFWRVLALPCIRKRLSLLSTPYHLQSAYVSLPHLNNTKSQH